MTQAARPGQSRSAYLAPLSNQQHSFFWMFSLIQDTKEQRWEEGERESCLVASCDPVSSILEAALGQRAADGAPEQLPQPVCAVSCCSCDVRAETRPNVQLQH